MPDETPNMDPIFNWPTCPFHGTELSLHGEPARNAAGHRFIWNCPHCQKGEINLNNNGVPMQQPVKGNYGFRDASS